MPTEQAAAAVGVAVVGAGDVTVAWADPRGVWTADASGAAPPQLLAAGQNVRSLSAASLLGDLAVGWTERDRNTGLNHHRVAWRGEVTTLFTDPLEVAIDFAVLEGRAYAAVTPRREGEARLTLLPLEGGAAIEFHRTPLAVRGVTYASGPGGALWAAWLEGRTERNEFGVKSEWHPYLALITGQAEAGAPLELGAADVSDERQRAVVIDAPSGAPDGAAAVMWTDVDGGLQVAEARATPGGLVLASREHVPTGVVPRPLAGAWPYLYWSEGTSFRRVDAGALLRAGAPAPDVVNVLWSPITVLGAGFASNAGLDAFAWFGRAQGGAVRIYTSDDGAPMAVTLRDRLARLMRWNPWFVWEQAIGQALTALLVGVLAVVVAIPFLLLASALAGRAARARGTRGAAVPRKPGVASGLVVGAVPVLAGWLVLLAAAGYGRTAPMAAVGALVVALILGGAAAFLVTRRGDREAQATMLIAAAVTVFGSAAVWSFVTYPDWAPLVGLA